MRWANSACGWHCDGCRNECDALIRLAPSGPRLSPHRVWPADSAVPPTRIQRHQSRGIFVNDQHHRIAQRGARLADPSAGGGGSGQEAMRVSFAVPYRCEFGQHIALVGSDEFLGDWDVQRGVPMNWQDGDVWTVDLELPPTCADRWARL